MAIIEAIITFADEHGKTVIVSLLGVILVGAIGGGILLKNMQTTIENQDRLINSRFELLKERYQNATSGLKQENVILSNQVSVLKNSLENIGKHLDAIIRTSYKETIGTGYVAKAISSIRALQSDIDMLEQNLDRTDEMAKLAHNIALAYAEPMGSMAAPETLNDRMMIALFFVSIVILLAVLLFRKTRQDG